MYHHEGSRYSATNLSQSLKVISIGRSTMQSGGERFSPLYYEISATLEGGSRELAERNKNTSRFVRSLSSIFFFSLSFFHSYISMDGGKEGRCLPKTCNRRCAIKKKRKKKDWGPETFRGRRSNIRATSFLLFYSRRAIYLSRPSTSTKICIDSERRPAFRRFYVSSFFFLFLVFFHARELQFKGRIIGSSKRKIRILVEKKRILEFLGDSLVARKK